MRPSAFSVQHIKGRPVFVCSGLLYKMAIGAFYVTRPSGLLYKMAIGSFYVTRPSGLSPFYVTRLSGLSV